MKLGTILAALTAATIGTASFSALAQTSGNSSDAEAGGRRTAAAESECGAKELPDAEQLRSSNRTSQTTPMEIGPAGRSRSPN